MNTSQIKKFKGLNNVSDPLRLGMSWLKTANNVNVTDTGAIVRRDGYALALACDPSGAFTTADRTRMYVVDAGTLKLVNADFSTVTLKTGLTTSTVQWAEVNQSVYYTNGTATGIIQPDGSVLDWNWPVPGTPNLTRTSGNLPPGTYQVACTYLLPDGRETGAGEVTEIHLGAGSALTLLDIPQIAGLFTQVYICPADSTVFQHAFSTLRSAATWNAHPDELGVELTTQFLSPPPPGGDIEFWRGRMHIAEYFPDLDTTVIWISEPLGYHLFDQEAGFISVKGECTLLLGHKDGLIIGTHSKLNLFDGEAMTDLADYGAVPGWGAVNDTSTGHVLFWSKRGLCSALPFSNLTLNSISVSSGIKAGAALIESNGAKRYVVALQKGGDPAFNQRRTA